MDTLKSVVSRTQKLRHDMFEAAKSGMTTDPNLRKLLDESLGDGLLHFADARNSVCFNTDGSMEDMFIDDRFEDMKGLSEREAIQKITENATTMELYISYSFGGGQPIYGKVGSSFRQEKPKKTIKEWTDAFEDGNVEKWERDTIAKLSKVDPRFPWAWIDYDSDFGFQGISLYILSEERGARSDSDW